MAPAIYTSPIPSIPIVARSVFTHLFALSPNEPHLIGGYPGSAPAFIDSDTGTTLTRAQTRSFALQLGFGLRHDQRTAASTQRGDVVLIFSPNLLSWPVVLFGSVAAGLRCTLANSSYTPKELAFQYSDSGAKLVFTHEDGISTVLSAFEELGISREEGKTRIVILDAGVEWVGGLVAPRRTEGSGLLRMQDLLQRGVLAEEEKFDGKDCHETAYICYSSGTTGKPKGVETTHQNFTSVLDTSRPLFQATHNIDSILGFLPFYHMYGTFKLLHYPLLCGVPAVIQSGFDPEKFCASIEKYKVTIALAVPPVLVVLARHPAVDKYDMSSLSVMFCAAAPLAADLGKQVTSRFLGKREKGRFCILQGYGLSEMSPTTHLLAREDGDRKFGSVGILLPNIEARLVVDGDGPGDIDAKDGEPGELWARGPGAMKGYLNNPSATKETITPDGWLKTGDIMIKDSEGYYYVVDRRKELIKYKGFQVAPAELESVLLTHPDIADVGVIGVESKKQATELPRAYVVPANPDQVQTEAAKTAFQQSVHKWMQGKVAYYKLLRGGIVIVDMIPKSASGKILRRVLREKAKDELSGRDPSENDVKPRL